MTNPEDEIENFVNIDIESWKDNRNKKAMATTTAKINPAKVLADKGTP